MKLLEVSTVFPTGGLEDNGGLWKMALQETVRRKESRIISKIGLPNTKLWYDEILQVDLKNSRSHRPTI